ncbi:MAG: chorismate mutase [Clostridia bacterium]
MNKLDNARQQINAIDEKMADLFEQRMKAVADVIEYKMENEMEIFDSSREQFVIDKNAQHIKNEEYLPYYKEFIKYVMDNSKKYQKVVSNQNIVGYQGAKGAFSHIASTRIFPDYIGKSYGTFEDVFVAIENGDVIQAVMPFENSYTGEIGDTLDLLSKYNCYIESVYDLPIDQNLLCLPDADIEDIKEVFSHEQGFFQCRDFFSKYDFKFNSYANTALAAQFVSKSKNKSFGAVASKETAEIYNLKILKSNINTSKYNTTRFIVIKNTLDTKGEYFNATFRTSNNAGNLAKVLSVIGNEGFNVVSIKSRAIPEEPWEYYFYMEVEASLEDEKTIALINKIKENCEQFKIIGSYFK